MRLVVENLVRHFGDVRAVDGVSFRLEAGEIFGFVGPTGAGKPTPMRILATLDEPASGDARLDGRSVVQHPEEARRRIGFMPDSLPTHSDMTVAEYLDFFARAYDIRGAARRRVLESVEEFTQLGGIRDKMISSLSKGMKQRVSLGRALVHDPSFLVLDEPAAGLDPRARVELRELLMALAVQGKAILISSHILSELSEICHGAVILEHGRIVHAGKTAELLDVADTWAVRVRSLGDAGELLRRLLSAPYVEDARQIGEEVEADLLGDEEAGVELLRFLLDAGERVVEFRRQNTGLEDVFLRVTKGEVR